GGDQPAGGRNQPVVPPPDDRIDPPHTGYDVAARNAPNAVGPLEDGGTADDLTHRPPLDGGRPCLRHRDQVWQVPRPARDRYRGQMFRPGRGRRGRFSNAWRGGARAAPRLRGTACVDARGELLLRRRSYRGLLERAMPCRAADPSDRKRR